MVRHVFMFKFVPGVTEKQMDEFAADMNALNGKLPGVTALHAGRNLQWSSDKADMVVIADVEDKKAWEAYLSHPLHLELGRRYSPLFDMDTVNAVQLLYK